MGTYSALVIPILSAIIMLYFFKRKVVWWELGLPIILSLIVIFIVKKSVQYSRSSDIDFHGSFIVEARYYEYWSTWKDETCSSTTTDSKGNSTTTYYDCSYCDEHHPYWEAIDNFGNKWNISEDKYNSLVKQWKAKPIFYNMNREIDTHWSCGKDGNMYYINWDRQAETSEPAVSEASYINKIKVSHTSLGYEDISDKEADNVGLYQYPKMYAQYKQEAILGIEKIYPNESSYIKHLFQYFNAYYGVNNHAKTFFLMFYGKPQNIALQQEAYWEGGNDNEIVVCIDVDSITKKLNWVRAFSWCDNKRLVVEIREEIMNQKYFNYQSVINST